MTGIVQSLANNLWKVASYPAWHRFKTSSSRVSEIQSNILFDYLASNQNTNYGCRYNFPSIKSIEDYQELVPITTYDSYLEEIEDISNGKEGILTNTPVRMLELSSGSTSPSKLIPYTDKLKSEFQTGIAIWIYNLFSHWPHLKNGMAYWSISPLTEGRKRTPGGVPIGFEDDSAYLGPFGKEVVECTFAVPNEVKNIRDIHNFRYVTLLFLLRQPNLRIISIWNPTYLSLLLEPLPDWWQSLVDDIGRGTITPPTPNENETFRALLSRLSSDEKRATVLNSCQHNEYQNIWPNLGLISCWMDGTAAHHVNRLRTQFPEVIFQGKGLIATEAFVSLPLVGLQGAALAYTSHFFEFFPVDSQRITVSYEQPKLAHELVEGQSYSVVVTTGGGLFRYQLNDIVKVNGYMDQVPLLRFLGKMNNVSDWFGEKLNEHFVAAVLKKTFQTHDIEPIFAMLAPDDSRLKFCYTLYLELESCKPSREKLIKICTDLDFYLRKNFHYDYCRKLGQLAPPEIFLIAEAGTEAFIDTRRSIGQRLGDIKLTPLDNKVGWEKLFPKYDN